MLNIEANGHLLILIKLSQKEKKQKKTSIAHYNSVLNKLDISQRNILLLIIIFHLIANSDLIKSVFLSLKSTSLPSNCFPIEPVILCRVTSVLVTLKETVFEDWWYRLSNHLIKYHPHSKHSKGHPLKLPLISN